MNKCIRVRGKIIGRKFQAINYQIVNDELVGITDDDHNTIMNVLRLRLKHQKSSRGFNYAFPIIFGN